ncbi:uncharacterized protein LOC113760078 [Coffea eugenioides]|uniref:uncharacterized protein LOC113760078 n=1 Tax=Coffea eugenioides TaxID=49369 RepID=UPI000F605EAC|nr:uncharacterized protein LOC113760078 [Coffea eugenioides]
MLDILFSNANGSGETSLQQQRDDTTIEQTQCSEQENVCGRQTETDLETQQQGARKKQVRRRRTRPTNHSSQGLEDIDSLQQDYIPDHLSSDNGSSDDEFKGRYKDFVLEKFLKDPKFEIGMKFESRAQFKSTVTEYGIRIGKPVWTCKNEPTRVRAKCTEQCKWFAFVSTEKALSTKDLVVKTMHDIHETCNHSWKNKNITTKWLSDRYVERIRSNNNLPTRELRQIVHEDYHTEISKHVAAKAKTLAIEKIKGSVESQYKKIWQYCEEIKMTHPSSTMEVMFTPFREPGCRYPGQLLIAIAVDPNNGYWPVAWGLDRALAEVLPNSEHRYCAQHMYRNFKKKHSGLGLKDRLWNIANCITVEHFNKAMDEFEEYDKEAHAWPINGDIQWAQSNMLELDPPASVTQPGRPKKARKRDVTEGKDHGKRLRRRVVIHCTKCGGIGHNAATCKNPPKSSSEQQSSQQPAPTEQPCKQESGTMKSAKNSAATNTSTSVPAIHLKATNSYVQDKYIKKATDRCRQREEVEEEKEAGKGV